MTGPVPRDIPLLPLQEPELDVIRDVAEQLELVASLVAAASRTVRDSTGLTRVRDISLPPEGLYALLTNQADRLRSALECAEAGYP